MSRKQRHPGKGVFVPYLIKVCAATNRVPTGTQCSTEEKLAKYRTVAKEHGVVTTGARAQATLINAISGRLRAMLLQAGVIGGAKGGEVSGLRLPNSFANVSRHETYVRISCRPS